MELNYNGFEYIQCANTARQVFEIDQKQEKAMRAAEREKQESIKRDERKVAGAEASIAQIGILSESYSKLKEMYDDQVKTNIEARKELRRSKWINLAMLIVAIISMLVAIAEMIK